MGVEANEAGNLLNGIVARIFQENIEIENRNRENEL